MKKSKYTVGNFKLRVRKSGTGKGLFAVERIPKGSCIIEYTGVLVPEDQVDKINSKYLFEINKNKTINGNVPSNLARYINHSCKPNCESDGPRDKVFISSIKNIKPGEELTYDYGEEYFEEYLSKGRCMCVKCSK
ncbi:MAG: histone-lysine N-methyltransferase MLL3 [Parcubacteria bacterium C7867-003]|nr:MAG: histone-lysine N-methyltransferase MLL3 [Parcubacteria bacterium C7867-003]